MDIQYGVDAEKKILGKLVMWDVFEDATEPEMMNYAYSKWYSAYVRAQWQMEVLRMYSQQHPEATKTRSWIQQWERRMEITECEINKD